MANTRYDIELKKRHSIVYHSLFWSNLKLNDSCRSFNMADITMNTICRMNCYWKITIIYRIQIICNNRLSTLGMHCQKWCVNLHRILRKYHLHVMTCYHMMYVMLLWVYIHTGQAWKIFLATVGIEPTTFGIIAQWSANWATQSD